MFIKCLLNKKHNVTSILYIFKKSIHFAFMLLYTIMLNYILSKQTDQASILGLRFKTIQKNKYQIYPNIYFHETELITFKLRGESLAFLSNNFSGKENNCSNSYLLYASVSKISSGNKI